MHSVGRPELKLHADISQHASSSDSAVLEDDSDLDLFPPEKDVPGALDPAQPGSLFPNEGSF